MSVFYDLTPVFWDDDSVFWVRRLPISAHSVIVIVLFRSFRDPFRDTPPYSFDSNFFPKPKTPNPPVDPKPGNLKPKNVGNGPKVVWTIFLGITF